MPKRTSQLIVGTLATNCWIYRLNETEAAVIDPGDEAWRIFSVMENLSLIPKYILLTHGHFDHIAAVPELAAAFNRRAPQIAIHRLDSVYLGEGAYKYHSVSIKAAMGDTSFIDNTWKNMPPPGRILEEGDAIGPFTVLHLPGHTRGSAAFWDREEGVLFTGDTLFKGDWGRTDLPGGDEDAISASLRRLLAMDGKIKVYPGHGSTTTINGEAGLLG